MQSLWLKNATVFR